jgi:hypothetical protein
MFQHPHASTVTTSTALSRALFFPERLPCGAEACGFFHCCAVHVASLVFFGPAR